jgi:uncharacterized protein YqjF (DUF2071 family)
MDDEWLLPLLPEGLALDRWQGKSYISLVCLFMDDLQVLSLPAWPRRFAELNLRFYVKPCGGKDDGKGVIFLRQLVSSCLVAFAGRVFFREPMLHTPMTYQCEPPEREHRRDRQLVYYRWADGGHDGGLRVTASGDSCFAEPGSLDEFLTRRCWGYNRTPAGRLQAYRISREPWQLVPVIDHELKCDPESLWGPEIADAIAGPPASVLLALGSETQVHLPTKLR